MALRYTVKLKTSWKFAVQLQNKSILETGFNSIVDRGLFLFFSSQNYVLVIISKVYR